MISGIKHLKNYWERHIQITIMKSRNMVKFGKQQYCFHQELSEVHSQRKVTWALRDGLEKWFIFTGKSGYNEYLVYLSIRLSEYGNLNQKEKKKEHFVEVK